jgi:hypothetical protein
MPLHLAPRKQINASQMQSAKMTYSKAQLKHHQEVELTTQTRPKFLTPLPLLKQDTTTVESTSQEKQYLPRAIVSIFSLQD